jgi:hypothetical protein
LRRPRKSRIETLADQLDRRVGKPSDEEITFTQALRNATELLAAYALYSKKDPQTYVKENLTKALADDEPWFRKVMADGKEEVGLSTPGIFRMIFHRPGQHFDRKNCYDQESVFQLVQQHLDESLKDPQAIWSRANVNFKLNKESKE